MKELSIRDEFIKLGQAMKLAGLVDNGAEAKEIIANGQVLVNNETEIRRGKKLYKGDVFFFQNEEIRII